MNRSPTSNFGTARTARYSVTVNEAFLRALAVSQGLAVLFWFVALMLHSSGTIPVWWDLQHHFINAWPNIGDPYTLTGWVYVPYAALILIPLTLLSLSGAALLQTCLLFGLVTTLIFRRGGTFRTLLIVLGSFIALDCCIESNIDWLIALALIIPREYSLVLILIKPQDAIGYMLTFSRRELVRSVALTGVMLTISLVAWGWWPIRMWRAIQTYTLGRSFNIAPLAVLPVPLALAIGAALGYVAWRRKDTALGVIAGVFVVPYLTLYSTLIAFTMVALKWPRLALIINLSMWAVYGGVFLLVALNR